jgi:hypothetical protein
MLRLGTNRNLALLALLPLVMLSCGSDGDSPTSLDGDGNGDSPVDMIIDHTCCDISAVPRSAVEDAVGSLHIAYGHTSHGSQLTTGMDSLAGFLGDDLYRYSNGGAGGTLDLHDGGFGSFGAYDLGNPDGSTWETATRNYLAANPDVNVVIWSWCGQVSSAGESYIQNYLDLMDQLEADYPDVRFVYMTGHLDGTGTTGNLHQRNEQIREYCRGRDRILFDFADIESYDPDGVCYLPLFANDACS